MAFFSRKKKIEAEEARVSTSPKEATPAAGDERGSIIAPVITEKAMRLAEGGTYVFRVARNASKRVIREAVDRMYGVHVERVSVMNTRGKNVSVGQRRGRSSGFRKAMVTLRKGEIINV